MKSNCVISEQGDEQGLARVGNQNEKLTGAEILLRALELEGVDTIFGYPGGTVLNIYDALTRSNLRHILTRHEQGAAHAADGYARVTGKPGVCIATSGPGATNLVTGIANAYMDSVPMIAITGQVAVDLVGRDSFQEADITGITMPITKANYLIKDINELAETVHEAFYVATTGRPGPVLIDLPKDITAQKADFHHYPPVIKRPGLRQPKNGYNNRVVLQVAEALSKARKPMVIVGGGVIASGAHQELRQLVENLQLPVTTTLMGKGAFPDTHPLALGMVGMHGTVASNYGISECDLLLALGVRFSDRVTGSLQTFATHAQLIHVDIDPAEIGKNLESAIPVVADAAQFLRDLIQVVSPGEYTEWRQQLEQWRQQFPLNYEMTSDEIKPQYVIEQIYQLCEGKALVATDVGQHQIWTAQYFKLDQPRRFVTSGGLGTMGFGLPAAIGAQIGQPDSPVFLIAGDGSIQMNSQELMTAVNYCLPIKICILNNGYLGMVRQWQELFYSRCYSQSDISAAPDFVKLAEAYGAHGIRVTKPEEVKGALATAMRIPQPVVIDFVVAREENVFPMVPPGGSLNKMLRR